MSASFKPELEKLNFHLASPSAIYEEQKDENGRVITSLLTVGKFEKKTMKQNSAQYHYVDVTRSASTSCVSLVKISRPMRRRSGTDLEKEIPRDKIMCVFNANCRDDYDRVMLLLRGIFSK